jgi:type IV pilus assembly protein PilA
VQYGRYASTLAELGPPAAGAPHAAAAGLISRGLASGEKGGYKYSLRQTEMGYTINANPVAFNNTGKRTFHSDQSLVTHQNSTAEPASAASPEVDPK